MALFIIVVQAHFVMNNIFEGMIWFFLPASMVITNDIFAYLVGITIGRTQLIQLSPKKTVEGFMGAWFFTVLFGVLMTNLLMRYSYFICPVNVSISSAQGFLPLISRPRTSALMSSRDFNALPTLFSSPKVIHYSATTYPLHLFNSTTLSLLHSPL